MGWRSRELSGYNQNIDPRGQGSDHHFHMSSVRLQNFAKQNKFQVKIMIAIGVTVGLAEWIIDASFLDILNFINDLSFFTIYWQSITNATKIVS